MPRLSKLIEKLEDHLEPKVGPWYEQHKKEAAPSTPPWCWRAGISMGWCSTPSGWALPPPSTRPARKWGSIWVLNPFRNWFVVFTPLRPGGYGGDRSAGVPVHRDGVQVVFRL